MKAGSPEHDLEREAAAARDMLAAISGHADDDDLVSDMIEGETNLNEAVQKAIAVIDDCTVTVEGCKSVIADLTARKDRAGRRIQTIRAAIEQAMTVMGRETMKTPTATLTVKYRPGAAIISEESEIPAEFWKAQPPKLDKKALNDAVAERDVPGAHQGNGTVSLTIRRK